MPEETTPPITNPEAKSKRLYFVLLIVAAICFLLPAVLLLQQVLAGTARLDASTIPTPALGLGLLLIVYGLRPIIVGPEYSGQKFLRAIASIIGFPLIGIAFALDLYLDIGQIGVGGNAVQIGASVIAILIGLAGAITFPLAITAPARWQEKKRQQDLLERAEALAKDDPKLYLLVELFREEFRKSGRSSLFQSMAFFCAGLVIPLAISYVVQSIVPTLLKLLQP